MATTFANLAAGAPAATPGQPRPLQAGEFVPSGPPNIVSIGLREVAPPSSLYIQRDDVLAFLFQSTFGADTLQVAGRFLRADDGVIVPFSFNLAVSSANARTLKTVPLGEGYLLSLTAVATSATIRGQMFCTAFLQRGIATAFPLAGANQVLFSDYIMQDQPCGWPGGRIVSAVEGTGGFLTGTAGSPAAGADITVAIAPNVMVRHHYVTATLTTSATVANRIPTFFIGGSSVGVFNAAPTAAQTATKVVTYILAAGINQYTDANGNVYMPLPTGLINPVPSTQFRTVTAGLQAGDQWSAINFTYEQFLAIS